MALRVKQLGGLVLVGATAYVANDACTDLAIYNVAKSRVIEKGSSHDRLLAALGGGPLDAGPWYDCSVVRSFEGHVATVSMPLRGANKTSDVTVRMVRTSGLWWTLLATVVDPGSWETLVMDAVVGARPGSGRGSSLSLLEAEVPDLYGGSGAPHAAQTHAPAAEPAAPAAAAKKGWRRLLFWRRVKDEAKETDGEL